jgi:S1-C subfamily serine protease
MVSRARARRVWQTGSKIAFRLIAAGVGCVAVALVSTAAVSQKSFVAPPSLAPLADKLSDAVVNISTTQSQKGPQGVPLPKVPKGSPFEEFFDDFFQKRGGKAPPDRKVSSLGSGFVIDAEGLIATNFHVIDGADEIIINFHDGTKLKVEKAPESRAARLVRKNVGRRLGDGDRQSVRPRGIGVTRHHFRQAARH